MVDMMLRQEQLRQLADKDSISMEETTELIGINEFLSAAENSEESLQELTKALDELIGMECHRLSNGGD